MPEETTLMSFASIMAITFALALVLFGAIWLLCWIGSLAFLVVLRAFNPSHPIIAEEEID